MGLGCGGRSRAGIVTRSPSGSRGRTLGFRRAQHGRLKRWSRNLAASTHPGAEALPHACDAAERITVHVQRAGARRPSPRKSGQTETVWSGLRMEDSPSPRCSHHEKGSDRQGQRPDRPWCAHRSSQCSTRSRPTVPVAAIFTAAVTSAPCAVRARWARPCLDHRRRVAAHSGALVASATNVDDRSVAIDAYRAVRARRPSQADRARRGLGAFDGYARPSDPAFLAASPARRVPPASAGACNPARPGRWRAATGPRRARWVALER